MLGYLFLNKDFLKALKKIAEYYFLNKFSVDLKKIKNISNQNKIIFVLCWGS